MDINNYKDDALITIDGEEIGQVKGFEYPGVRIEAKDKSTSRKRRRLTITKAGLKMTGKN